MMKVTIPCLYNRLKFGRKRLDDVEYLIRNASKGANDWRAAYEERNDQIRKARAAGVSAAQLAQEFGVSIWTIHWVLRQKVKA